MEEENSKKLCYRDGISGSEVLDFTFHGDQFPQALSEIINERDYRFKTNRIV